MTRIPVGRLDTKNNKISKSCWAFSVCGFVVCIIALIVFHLSLEIGLSQHIAAILFIIINLFLTGAIHEDGLADLADGFFVKNNVNDKLKIMNDSRIGVFGTLALILFLSLKIFSLSSLSPDLNTYLHLIFISMLSRYFMLIFLRFLKPIKKSGLGKNFSIEKNSILLIGLLPMLPLIFFLNFNSIILFFSMFITCLIFFRIIGLKFKGQSGDICGASQQINETVGLLVLTLIF